MHNGSGNGHGGMADQIAISSDLIDRHRLTGSIFRISVLVTGILFLLGVAGFVIKVVKNGTGDPSEWGYYAALVSFLLTAGSGAVMVAIATRMVKAHWRRSISRSQCCVIPNPHRSRSNHRSVRTYGPCSTGLCPKWSTG